MQLLPAARLETIERACREKGLRVTGQRRVIAGVLAEANDHPDVTELHRRAAIRDERISLATVYRTVKMFQDIGVIERHAFQDGRARYERKPTEHHDHLIDMQSGKVIEFHSEEIEQLQRGIAEKLGYRLTGHKLELYAVPLKKKER